MYGTEAMEFHRTDEHGDLKKLNLVCYKCVGTARGKDPMYYVNKHTGNLRPEWTHAARKSKFVPTDSELEKVARGSWRGVSRYVRRDAPDP